MFKRKGGGSMEQTPLYDLIRHIEMGTNLHIGVLFFENYGNEQCALPSSHQTHICPACTYFKDQDPASFRRCFRCRNLSIRKAQTTRKPFGNFCINGIYEYIHPVCIGKDAAFMIFIGNILEKKEGKQRILQHSKKADFPFETMETAVSLDDCRSIATVLERYILFLLETYPGDQQAQTALIRNIKNYIISNLEFEIDIQKIAALFHYNERYLGRLFKKETGRPMKQYIAEKRIETAKRLLRNTRHTVLDIANETGFRNVTYFNRLFKEQTGLTPLQYRNQKTPPN